MSNRNIRSLGRRFGFEDDGETPMMDASEVDESGAPIKGDETVEAEELAVDEASDEVTEEIEATEDLEQAEETLESIYAVLKDAKDSGRGISQESARFMSIAIDGIRIRGQRLGVDAVGVPSFESFGRSSRQQSNTELSLEGVGDTLKAIWEWIKTQIKKLVAKIKNWYLKVLDAAPRLKKRAEAIKKKADGTSGSTDESTVEISVHRQLHINKKAESPENSKKALTTAAEIIKQALSKTDTLTKAVDEAIDALVTDDANKIKAALDEAIVGAGKTTGMTVVISAGKFLGADRFDADAVGKGTPELLGGKAYVYFVRGSAKPSTPAEAKKMIQGAKAGFENVSKKALDLDSSADYKVLSTGDVADFCDTVIDICDYIIDYKKQWEDRQKAGDKLTKACDKLKTRVDKDKEKSGDASRDIKDAAQAVYSYWAKSISRDTGTIGYGLTTGRCVLTWCERSLSTYK